MATLLAVVLFVVALYWTIAAAYELAYARKPPGIFGKTLLRSPDPEPVLSVNQWRKGALFLLLMSAALVIVGWRFLVGW